MLASTRKRSFSIAAALAWVLVALLALVTGAASAERPLLAIAVLVMLGIGWLVIARRLTALVPMATLALAWGTSTLPFVSVAYVAKFALLGAIGATIVPWLLTRDRHLPVSIPFTVAFGVLTLVATMSVAWSVSPATSLQKAISLALLATAALIAVPLNCRRERDARAILWWNGATAATFTMLGLAAGITGLLPAFESNARFHGLLNSPNALGFWIAPILPCLVVMATQERPGRRRVVLVLSIVVLAVGLAISGSRGGTMASIAGVLIAFLASGFTGQGRTVKRTVAIGIAAFAAVAFALPALGLTLRSQTSGNVEGFLEIGSGSGRTVVWEDAIPLIEAEPLHGHGFGMTPELFPAVQERAGRNVLGRTHNSYLEAAVDLGWPGLALLVALVVSAIVAAWNVVRHPGPHRALATVLLAGIAGGAVEGFFESGLLSAGSLLAFPFWLIVGLAHSLRAAQRRGDARVSS